MRRLVWVFASRIFDEYQNLKISLNKSLGMVVIGVLFLEQRSSRSDGFDKKEVFRI